MTTRVLVTGSNGFIGSLVVSELLRTGFHVIALSRGENRVPQSPNLKYYSADITDESTIEGIFAKEKPNIVVHCAAISLVDACETNPDLCENVNVTGTKILVKQAQKHKAHFVFMSSDFVFDGRSAWVTESTKPQPISVYGKSKLKGEMVVRSSKVKWTIIRPVLVYGFSPYAVRSNIFTWVLQDLIHDKTVQLAEDQMRTPTFVGDLVKIIIWIIDSKAEGVFNVGGPTHLSVFEFGDEIGKMLGIPSSRIQARSSLLIPNAHLRPLHSCFDTKPLEKSIGESFLSVKEGVQLAYHQWKYHIHG